MENLIVEVIVREPAGTVRAARPGEIGEVAITDLHNLASPRIRHITGDVAVARAESRCACGRGLVSIGSIDGRVTEALLGGGGEIPLTSAGKRTAVIVQPGTASAARAAMLA
jgi:phenylacetate-CoA ligase